MAHSLPALDGDDVRQQILMLQREPFRHMLANLLACAPDEETLRAFARKSPDRWAQAVAIFQRGAGYTEKVTSIENNWFIQVNALSDADLLREYERTQSQLEAMQARPVIEHDAIESPAHAGAGSEENGSELDR